MRHVKLNDHIASPCFFDMASRFRPHQQARWYGSLMRIGDKAAIYGQLAKWRQTNQNRKLVILADPIAHESYWASHISNAWLFSEIADLLIEDETGNAVMQKPIGENLYHQHIFTSWKQLSQHPPIRPAPPMPDLYRSRADQLLAKWKVPARFAVMSPLFDAKYDTHRNLHPTWWHDTARLVSRELPLVIVGDRAAMHSYPTRNYENVHNIYLDSLNAMQSLALIEKSSVYIGGETGLTLWAALMKVPVAACYQFWHVPWNKNQQRNIDTRPISAGAPVAWAHPPKGPQGVLAQVRTIARR